jgi:hypothetical protein
MFTPMPIWADAMGAQHSRTVVIATKASKLILDMISPRFV